MPILGRMTRREKQWALWTILAGVFLGFLLCTGVHVCMGARLDRPPYHWYSLLDLVWAGALVLLATVLVAEYRMWGMAGVLLGVCVLRLVMGGLGALLLPFEITALVLVGTRASKRMSRPRIVEKPASMLAVPVRPGGEGPGDERCRVDPYF